MDFPGMSDQAILKELGARANRQRLNQNITQVALARQAGVARIVIHRLESGLGCNLESLIRILRALGLLSQLDAFLPEPGISPVQLLKLKRQERQRASGPHQPKKRKA